MYPDIGISALTPIIGSGFSDIICSSKSISKSLTESEKITLNFFGCSKNLYDSEILISQLKANNKNVVHEEDGNIIDYEDAIS